MSQTPEEIALFLIRQNAQNREENLTLADLWLTALPDELWELTHLKELNLYRNKLVSLPTKIGKLHNLTQLDISYNQLTSLPSELEQLTHLEQLNVEVNKLTNLPPEIGHLSNLQRLRLGRNQLIKLPVEFSLLSSLEILFFSNNGLSVLPTEIMQMPSLTSLDFSSNHLISLPPEIGRLEKLTNFSLSDNELFFLPPEIGELANLREFYLYKNRLTGLPPEIGKITNLERLSVSNNQLLHLPTEIIQLTNLADIYLDGNQLTSLPKEITELQNLTSTTLLGNPLEMAIPAKWLEIDGYRSKHAQEILAHYKRMYEEGGRELGEARVLVVGDGRVGKTSLVKRLIDNTFDDHEDSTFIVEKRPLPMGNVRAQMWDFGGQEHMHATHQFFFSGRSLYLLVFDTGKTLEQNNIEYWLTLINAYSQNAPVILVGNKCDQHEMDIEKRRLREKYPNIRGFVGTSASTGEHIAELRQKIQEEVRAMPQVRVLFSADYLAVKDEMENLSAAHISHEQFVAICERHGVSDEKDQDTLLDLLHDLGTVLYFRDADGNPLLPALGVLNPNWVTRGVYLIVTNPALKDKFKGKLTMSHLREILSDREYSHHIEDIIKLLERFELCYRADDSSYWLPSLMAKEIDEDLTHLKSSAMKFAYGYPELPKSVIVRFIVKTHTRILDNKVWRSGVVLKLDGNTALVQADEEDKRVNIFITGEESTRRDALAILRTYFDDIHTMFATPPESFIYSPQYPDFPLDFEEMKILAKTDVEYKKGDKGKGLSVTINLRELLDGFVTLQERRKDEEREENEFGRRGGDTYITHNTVTVHGNVQGSAVTAGEGNTSSVSVQSSFNTFPAELQNTLNELIKSCETLLQKAESSEHTEEIKDELASLQTESKKSKPKMERVKITVKSLAQAARNLNEIGQPVLELAMTAIKLINTMPG